jgi:hypothetical protein
MVIYNLKDYIFITFAHIDAIVGLPLYINSLPEIFNTLWPQIEASLNICTLSHTHRQLPLAFLNSGGLLNVDTHAINPLKQNILNNLIVGYPVQTLAAFYRTRRSINIFTRACHRN